MDSWREHIDPARRPRLGVASCLLGERVRYDGRHKRDSFLVEELAPHVELVAVCPEFELEMGVPRPPLRLQLDELGERRMLDHNNGIDWTERMRDYAAAKCEQLSALGLAGYLFKSGSPSCALGGLTVHAADGRPLEQVAPGFFAAALVELLPQLAVLDETGLAQERQRGDFLLKLFRRLH